MTRGADESRAPRSIFGVHGMGHRAKSARHDMMDSPLGDVAESQGIHAWTLMSSAIAAASVLLAVAIATSHSVKRRRRMSARCGDPPGEGGEEPPHPEVAHPSSDTNICIGSLSCLKACPEGDILASEGHGGPGPRGPLHRPWPVRRRMPGPGHPSWSWAPTSEASTPEVDEAFESAGPASTWWASSRAWALLRNAIRAGLHAARRLDAILPGAGARARPSTWSSWELAPRAWQRPAR